MRITENNRSGYYKNTQSNYPKRTEKVRISQPDVVTVEDGRSPYGSGTPDNVERAMKMPYYHRYDIVLVDFGNDYEHCLTCETRPAIVISPTEYSSKSPILLTIPMTKHFKFIDMECHLFIDKCDCAGLTDSGMALGEQIRCVDRTQVKRKIGMITDDRVSTDGEEQLQSFQSQKSYYEEKISKNKDWTLVGIYADEAITGTKTAKRDGLVIMI